MHQIPLSIEHRNTVVDPCVNDTDMPSAIGLQGSEHRSAFRQELQYVPLVSVIVPVYQDATSLRLLLRALAEQTYPAQRFECVLIDNGGATPVCVDEQYAFDVRVFREARPGSYAARNRGIHEARGEVLAFTDADCLPQTDWLARAVARLQSANGSALVAGQVEVICDHEQSAGALAWYSVLNDLNQARFVSQFHFAATANMIISREAAQRVGEFDAALFSGGDFEWGRRAWARGIEQIYSQEVVVRHPARTTWGALVARARRITGGHYQLNRKTLWPLSTTVVLIVRIASASMLRACCDPRLPTLGCRLKVMAIDLVLRLVQFAEAVRLRFGGRPSRC
jgi:GT2 family glycosyltransferase